MLANNGRVRRQVQKIAEGARDRAKLLEPN
jgi:hypothetical protein